MPRPRRPRPAPSIGRGDHLAGPRIERRRGRHGDRGNRHQARSRTEAGVGRRRKPRATHWGWRESPIPYGAQADRRALRHRRLPHPAARLPALRTSGHLEQNTRRPAYLPQLRRQGQRRDLFSLRNDARTRRPRRQRKAVVRQMLSHRSGQLGAVHPLPTSATCQQPQRRRAGLRDLRSPQDRDLQHVWANRTLHRVQNHRTAAVRRVCTLMGVLLTLRSVSECPRRHPRGAIVRPLRRPRSQLLEDLSSLRRRRTPHLWCLQPLPPPPATPDTAYRYRRSDQP